MRTGVYASETEAIADLQQMYLRARSALEAIRGPEDSGPWIDAYRAAGGGYAGLQAIAEEALK